MPLENPSGGSASIGTLVGLATISDNGGSPTWTASGCTALDTGLPGTWLVTLDEAPGPDDLIWCVVSPGLFGVPPSANDVYWLEEDSQSFRIIMRFGGVSMTTQCTVAIYTAPQTASG